MNDLKHLSRGYRFPTLVVLTIFSFAACGGGGGGGGTPSTTTTTTTSTTTTTTTTSTTTTTMAPGSSNWVSGQFTDASNFEALCDAPRSGTDPFTGLPYPDEEGSTVDENDWLRSWSNDLYLWYDEITDRDPADYTTLAYFDLLKTIATTPSGNPKDKFHFTIDTAEYQSFAQSGVLIGYGVWFAILKQSVPREAVVAYTDPGSPATTDSANLSRGATLLEIDGIDIVNTIDNNEIDAVNAALSPLEAGESHDFVVQDLGSATTRSFTMVSAEVTSVPVQHVDTIDTASGTVGYMLFNDHVATAEGLLIDAVNELKAADITDLVLDLRYNGGGFLAIADQLAYMIAGPAQTAGETFEALQFNDKHTVYDPVTGALLTPWPFIDETLGFSVTEGAALPSLDLTRVYILTGPDTCSASESVINSLRGIDVEVIQIGSTTCGKPYGFYAFDNCGTTYFSINFRGVNAKDFGDYTDGFSPSNASLRGTEVPGCSVADDFTHAFADPDEGRLAAALAYRIDGTCPAATGISERTGSRSETDLSAVDGTIHKSPWLQNRILGR
ncbi:MAG: S41 family peptidase [Desulfobacterales bacterium]